MNKTELIEALAPRLGGRAQAAAAVEAVVDLVLREVAAGRSVGITGFGTFEKVDRAPRTGRNPRTGEPVPIAGTSTPRFRPGAYFKDVVADPSALPPQGLAGVRVGSDGRLERTGAPSSVRRAEGSTEAAEGSPTMRSGEEGTGAKSPRSGRRRHGAPDEGRDGRRAGRVSGTPESVRKDSDPAEQTGSNSARSDTSVPAPGRIMAGGEEISQGMIWAKKAQLARVKNDELVARQGKQAKKDKKDKKDEKRSTKADKTTKVKKASQDTKVDKPNKAAGKGAKKKSKKSR